MTLQELNLMSCIQLKSCSDPNQQTYFLEIDGYTHLHILLVWFKKEYFLPSIMEDIYLWLVHLCQLCYWGAGDDYHTNKLQCLNPSAQLEARGKQPKKAEQQRVGKEQGVEGKVSNREWNEQTEGMGNREKGKSIRQGKGLGTFQLLCKQTTKARNTRNYNSL